MTRIHRLAPRGLAFLAAALLIAAADALPAAESTAVRQPCEQIRVLWQGREVAIHHSGPALDKSFIHPFWTPDRRCITYDAPADHIHHRGLSVGWPDLSGVDFWAEINAPAGRRGKMVPREVFTAPLHAGGASIAEVNDWVGEDGKALVRERRQWRFLPPRGNVQLVDVDLALTAVAPEVVFGSDPQKPREYHGLTLRIGPFEQPRFFNSEGAEGDQNIHGKPARWVALSGLQNGGPVTAAILDHPSNERHPNRFFVLGTGMQFISSSPNFGAPKVLKEDQSWNLRYRVVAAGAPPEGRSWDLDALWKEFAE